MRIDQEWWAELTINPVPGDHCEAFIQVVFEGTLLDKAAARPYEILFKDALTGLLTAKDGRITQAFISDDLEPGDLPMESGLRIPSRRAWEESATFLRNVSWITYLNAGMVSRLRDHGISVDDVGAERWTSPAEGVMIQFTEHLEDFTDETVIAAWRSLLPLLSTDEQPSRPPRYASRTLQAFF